MFQQRVHDFAKKEFELIALELDKAEEFPMENFKKAAQFGLTGIAIPTEYGGRGLDYSSYAILL